MTLHTHTHYTLHSAHSRRWILSTRCHHHDRTNTTPCSSATPPTSSRRLATRLATPLTKHAYILYKRLTTFYSRAKSILRDKNQITVLYLSLPAATHPFFAPGGAELESLTQITHSGSSLGIGTASHTRALTHCAPLPLYVPPNAAAQHRRRRLACN